MFRRRRRIGSRIHENLDASSDESLGPSIDESLGASSDESLGPNIIDESSGESPGPSIIGKSSDESIVASMGKSIAARRIGATAAKTFRQPARAGQMDRARGLDGR